MDGCTVPHKTSSQQTKVFPTIYDTSHKAIRKRAHIKDWLLVCHTKSHVCQQRLGAVQHNMLPLDISTQVLRCRHVHWVVLLVRWWWGVEVHVHDTGALTLPLNGGVAFHWPAHVKEGRQEEEGGKEGREGRKFHTSKLPNSCFSESERHMWMASSDWVASWERNITCCCIHCKQWRCAKGKHSTAYSLPTACVHTRQVGRQHLPVQQNMCACDKRPYWEWLRTP